MICYLMPVVLRCVAIECASPNRQDLKILSNKGRNEEAGIHFRHPKKKKKEKDVDELIQCIGK